MSDYEELGLIRANLLLFRHMEVCWRVYRIRLEGEVPETSGA